VIERPILFSGPMVRALLAGRKTQTRRVVKGLPERSLDYDRQWHANVLRPSRPLPKWSWWDGPPHGQSIYHTATCPYGQPGDRLWVRETLRRAPDLWTYAADGAEVGWPARRDLALKERDVVVSIHMPRAACRLTLEITDVRIERLHDISEDDAEAEGVREPSIGPIHMVSPEACGEVDRETAPALFLWEMLWRSINGADSWEANPWVWALSFNAVPEQEKP
jgi:hypothetical protein